MERDIAALRQKIAQAKGSIQTRDALEAFERTVLGRKGELAALTGDLKNYPPEQRKKFGAELNRLRAQARELVGQLHSAVATESGPARRRFDVTRPGKRLALGHLHPLTQVRREVERIFLSMGFDVVEGPEVETEWYNFDALNMPKDHPAREMQDTFWLQSNQELSMSNSQSSKKPRIPNLKSSRLLLRTQTSPVQVRYMETHRPPLRIIVPGRVFRYEAADASHDIQFHQVEGLMVDKAISLANFKAVTQAFFERFLRGHIKTRLRPGYFPFVEPGFEVDATCPRCRGRGCASCKQSGWMELMGAGMVHQQVFVNAGYQRNEWTGFAFGIGFDRLTMVKYGIDDIRLFYGGDMRFLKQF
ncbi:MAG: phenylalanine--tRNA ligase subunit alpha [bacterium]|nr:phenylalanine--tRNA ligase subunit alpha [bacterium]